MHRAISNSTDNLEDAAFIHENLVQSFYDKSFAFKLLNWLQNINNLAYLNKLNFQHILTDNSLENVDMKYNILNVEFLRFCLTNQEHQILSDFIPISWQNLAHVQGVFYGIIQITETFQHHFIWYSIGKHVEYFTGFTERLYYVDRTINTSHWLDISDTMHKIRPDRLGQIMDIYWGHRDIKYFSCKHLTKILNHVYITRVL